MYTEFVRVRLTQERKNAGYTQRQVAEKTGIRQSLLAKIEVGLRYPDIETVGTLAEFYNVSVDYLFGLGTKERKTR